MKRSLCSHCQYPLKTCVCRYTSEPFTSKTRITVLQHPDEVSVAKNTVRLLSLQLTNFEVIIGEQPSDFQRLIRTINPQETAVLYPANDAVHVESLSEEHQKNSVKHLLVIDGTWKKTNKVMALNTWLHDLPKVSFRTLPTNEYFIRKAEQTYSLSTLEAVNHFLVLFESMDPAPLKQLLQGMISEQTKFMPEEVKKRYLTE